MTGRRTTMIVLFTVVVCTVAALAAGCASTPASRYYTLSSTAGPAGAAPAAATPAAAAPAPAASGLAVEVGPVLIPAMVDRREIVVSAGANEVRLEEFNRWAAPLQDNLSRVIAENLLAMLGTPRVTVFPQTLGADADYRVAIDVQRFESVPGTSATVDAVWIVRRTKDGKEARGRTAVREPVQNNSYEALAAAHSRAVARLSQDIADVIRGLDASLGLNGTSAYQTASIAPATSCI
jgi:uncharacterized lipoprotein YmbA